MDRSGRAFLMIKTIKRSFDKAKRSGSSRPIAELAGRLRSKLPFCLRWGARQMKQRFRAEIRGF